MTCTCIPLAPPSNPAVLYWREGRAPSVIPDVVWHPFQCASPNNREVGGREGGRGRREEQRGEGEGSQCVCVWGGGGGGGVRVKRKMRGKTTNNWYTHNIVSCQVYKTSVILYLSELFEVLDFTV